MSARSRVRTQWLALAAALVVLAGVLVAWAVGRAAERVPVVVVAGTVEAGTVIERADLAVASVAVDGAVSGLVPDTSLERLVGKVAAMDLAPGTLVQVGMWRDAPELAPGEQRIGAVLPMGRYPAGLARGDTAHAAPLDPTDPTPPVPVRVLDVQAGARDDTVFTLAVPEATAVPLAQLAANGLLVLVGLAPEGGTG